MERHSVRGARSDQPTERRRPEARRNENAHFRTGCRGATHRCRPFTAKPHAPNSKRRCTATPPPALHPLPAHRRPLAPTVHERPPPAPSFTRGAQWPLPPDEKNKGTLSRKHGGSLEKAGNFFEIHGGLTSLSPLKSHHDAHKTNKTTSSHHKFPISVLIRGGCKKLVSFLFGQQGRDVYFCGVLQQYYTKTLHTMTI